MALRLDIPDSVLQSIQLPESEIPGLLKIELAIGLYAQGVLSLGKAAELAEMELLPFGQLIGERGIPRQYGEEDLAADISYARGE